MIDDHHVVGDAGVGRTQLILGIGSDGGIRSRFDMHGRRARQIRDVHFMCVILFERG